MEKNLGRESVMDAVVVVGDAHKQGMVFMERKHFNNTSWIRYQLSIIIPVLFFNSENFEVGSVPYSETGIEAIYMGKWGLIRR